MERAKRVEQQKVELARILKYFKAVNSDEGRDVERGDGEAVDSDGDVVLSLEDYDDDPFDREHLIATEVELRTQPLAAILHRRTQVRELDDRLLRLDQPRADLVGEDIERY